VLCYSGYTLAALRGRAARQPIIAEVLAAIDALVDGPYLAAAAARAGSWRGSGNQRVVDLAARRRPAPSRTPTSRSHNNGVVV
jgi:anaerobic ribonucleoside-triphosphate reductase activating protein